MPIVKPHSPRLNPSHPLAEGLLNLWPISEGGGYTIRDPVRHSDAIDGGFSTWANGELGVELQTIGGGSGDASAPHQAYYNRTQFSAVVSFRDDALGNGHLVRKVSAGQDQFSFEVQSTGFLRWSTYTSSEVSLDWIGALSAGVWHTIVGTYNGTIMRLYRDGIENASTSAQTGALAGLGHTNESSILFSVGNGVRLAMIALYGRALSGSEAVALHQDPFAMLRPRRPIFKAPAAVAGNPWYTYAQAS